MFYAQRLYLEHYAAAAAARFPDAPPSSKGDGTDLSSRGAGVRAGSGNSTSHSAATSASPLVRFCLIMDGNELGILQHDLARVVGYFHLPQYQTVLGGRPLVFTFSAGAYAAAPLALLVNATVHAGLPPPYIVAMGWGDVQAQATAAKVSMGGEPRAPAVPEPCPTHGLNPAYGAAAYRAA